MTIQEFRLRLASVEEGAGLFAALRQLTRLEDPLQIAQSRPDLGGWPAWQPPRAPAAMAG